MNSCVRCQKAIATVVKVTPQNKKLPDKFLQILPECSLASTVFEIADRSPCILAKEI